MGFFFLLLIDQGFTVRFTSPEAEVVPLLTVTVTLYTVWVATVGAVQVVFCPTEVESAPPVALQEYVSSWP